MNSAEQERAQFGADPFGLNDAGLIEGKTVSVERRYAEGKSERLPALAQELIEAKVDLIIGAGDSVYAAARLTKTIPIVMASGGDLVGMGFAESLSHPGGNVSGTVIFYEFLSKRLALLIEAAPLLRRVGLLLLRGFATNRLQVESVASTASLQNVELVPIEAELADVESVLDAAVRQGLEGLVVSDAGKWLGNAAALVALCDARRLPAAGPPLFATKGALIGFGVDFREVWRHAGALAAKVLNGERIGDVPLDRVSRYRSVVNLKTAKALGLTIPPDVLALADEVIE